MCRYVHFDTFCFFFFFNDTATTEIYTLSLHDALPICPHPGPDILRNRAGISLVPRQPIRRAQADEPLVTVQLPHHPASVGDSQAVWELNRHQWLAPLGTADPVSGDERRARPVAVGVRAWV